MNTRRKTRAVRVGKLCIGGDAPISVQSMTNTDTRDLAATLAQTKALVAAGCELVRISVFDMQCAENLAAIRAQVDVPLVADIHFDYTLALAALEAGVDKLRINPGNIGSEARVREVTQACKARGVPIRIGVNAGSLQRSLLDKYGGPTPEALVESALSHVAILEKQGFEEIIIALKTSNVRQTVESYRLIAERCAYPLHLGITEAGALHMGQIKSAIGIGALLLDGIGDTLRVSLTADPIEEVGVGLDILRALDLRRDKLEIISCPTCGRCRIDVEGIVAGLEKELADVRVPIKVAVMGCVVNGPGEAREADLGIAGGEGAGVFFRKGEAPRRVEGGRLIEELVKAIRELEADA